MFFLEFLFDSIMEGWLLLMKWFIPEEKLKPKHTVFFAYHRADCLRHHAVGVPVRRFCGGVHRCALAGFLDPHFSPLGNQRFADRSRNHPPHLRPHQKPQPSGQGRLTAAYQKGTQV